VTLPATAREIAESLNVHMPQRAGTEVIDTPRYAAILVPGEGEYQNVVQRLRLRPEEVEPVVGEVRARFVAAGSHRVTWEIGPSATPGDLVERLVGLGMVPEPREPLVVGMVLARPLPSSSTGVVVRRVIGLDEFRIASAILSRGFGGDGEEEDPAAVLAAYARHSAVRQFARYLAYLGDAPVAAADALFDDAGVVMNGGVTLPEARGRGAYRALIAARWEEGVRRGTPALITQAGAMSRPILKRLGFEEVAEIRVLLDEIGKTAEST
jgi:hypothetical protein